MEKREFAIKVCAFKSTIITFDWNNKLWDDRQDLASTLIQQVVDSLASQESIWFFRLTES